MVSAREARRDVLLFLVLLVGFSSVFYTFVLLMPDARRQWLSYSGAFMWCPGAAALLTQLLRHGNVKGLGWRRGRARHYLVAYGVPLAFCVPVYVFVWVSGFGAFHREPIEAARMRLGLPPGPAGVAAFVLLALLLAPVAGMAATLGEELGWRGLLVPRLAVLTDLTRTSLITGLLWAVWHYPVNVAVLHIYLPHVPLWYATVCFTISVVAISFVYTWLRLNSDSVWPATLLHAASNAYEGSFETVTTHGPWTSYLTYEYGAGFAVLIPLIAIPFWRRLAAWPGETPPDQRAAAVPAP